MTFESAYIASTRVPNEVLDRWLLTLSGDEFKVAMYVVRQTNGFTRVDRKIRTQDVADATGLRKRDVRAAMRTLVIAASYSRYFTSDRPDFGAWAPETVA